MGVAAGILLVLMGIVHNIYGEKKQIPALKQLTDDPIAIGSQRIMIYQGGLLLVAIGLVQLLDSLGVIHLTGIARYFPLGIVLINLLTALAITLFLHREIFRITVPQFVIFAVIVALQILAVKG